MACPSCGKKFYSDFKLAESKRYNHREILTNVFEMPSTIVGRIGKFFNTK